MSTAKSKTVDLIRNLGLFEKIFPTRVPVFVTQLANSGAEPLANPENARLMQAWS